MKFKYGDLVKIVNVPFFAIDDGYREGRVIDYRQGEYSPSANRRILEYRVRFIWGASEDIFWFEDTQLEGFM